MTLPDERVLALLIARELLLDLSLSSETVDLQSLRERATHALRHYPDAGMVELIARGTIWLDWPKRK